MWVSDQQVASSCLLPYPKLTEVHACLTGRHLELLLPQPAAVLPQGWAQFWRVRGPAALAVLGEGLPSIRPPSGPRSLGLVFLQFRGT